MNKTDDKPNSKKANVEDVPAITIPSAQKQGSGGLSRDPEKAERQLAALQQTKWKPGQTGNPSGRPKDPLKEIGKRIAKARVGKVLKPKERQLADDMGFNSRDITLLEQLMLSLATSKNPQKIALFLERTYGKVPNININAEVNAQLVTRFRAKFTDAELEQIADGANPMDILLDKLPNVDDNENDTSMVQPYHTLDDVEDGTIVDDGDGLDG